MPSDSSPLVPGSSPLDGKGEEPTAERQELSAISARVAGKGKVRREEMESVVLQLCGGRYLTLAELSDLLVDSLSRCAT